MLRERITSLKNVVLSHVVVVWLSTPLTTRQPITKECGPGTGRICEHAQLCTATCLWIEMRRYFDN